MRVLWLVALVGCGRTEEPVKSAPPPLAPASKVDATPTAAPPPGPNDVLPEGTETQNDRFEQARAALAAGDENAAIGHFLAAVEGPVTGTQVSASLAVADLLNQRGRAPEARAIYESLLARAGHLAEVQFTAGRFFGGEDPERALEAFRATLKLQPDFLPAYPLFGALLVEKGLKEEAAATLLEYERRLVMRLRQVESPKSPEAERVVTIDLLSLVLDERSEAVLRRLLGDASPAVRMAAANAVAEQDEPEALVALANALTAERDFTARQVLKEALGRARDRAVQAAPGSAPASAPGSATP